MSASKPSWRSSCPLNIALEIFGDRWTLLILRDLLVRNRSTFREFQSASEGIATNILSARLKKLTEEGIITSMRSEEDARVVRYRPTAKGLDLLPTIVEMILWAAKYEKTAASATMIDRLTNHREELIAQTRARFEGASD
ncbi:winged helix-turn-helix transcriptional regulator [Blastopirellula marina]|uniref:Transcriptional regulator n=1 Tax=Blastopirellula marina TaxID=124 RepID=A0A2S8GLT5_9BACT|nr:helix-turn-helix domain-containing protein [Blastopirellula marina]PQO45397.1 transcriptional regulator [Blastopirellula marina]